MHQAARFPASRVRKHRAFELRNERAPGHRGRDSPEEQSSSSFLMSWLLGKRKADAPPESTCFFSGCRRGSRHQATCEPCLLKICSLAILGQSYWRESQSKPPGGSRPRRNILSDTTRDRVRLMKAKPSKPDQLLNDSYRESPQITAALKVAGPDK